MQPQSDKSLVDRFLEWWRGLWGQPGIDRESATPNLTPEKTSHVDGVDRSASQSAPVGSPLTSAGENGLDRSGTNIDSKSGALLGQPEPTDPATSNEIGPTGATSASYDEFSGSGYAPGTTDLVDVEAAIDPVAAQESQGTVTTGTTDAGGLGAGPKDSPDLTDAPTSGDQHRNDTEATADAIRDESADSGVDITEDLGIGAVVGSQGSDAISEEDAEALVTDYIPDDKDIDSEVESADAVGVGSVGDLSASELGTLEDVELVSTDHGEVSDDAKETAADSAKGDGDESSSYTASEDSLGDSLGATTVSPGQIDTEDAGPIADITQQQPGNASDANGLTGAGDEAMVGTGLFGTSDIDTTDLSYLDDADNNRFDFTDSGKEPDLAASEASHPQAATSMAVDDTGASATTELVPDGGSETAVSESEVVATTPSEESNNESASAATSAVSGVSGQGAEVTARQDAAGPAGSIRGDGSGSCPTDYPIKGNKSSKIYHTPGLSSYQGTKAEWCFATVDDAIAAGYRAPGPRNASGKTGAGPASPTPNRPANTETQAGSDASGASQATDSVSTSVVQNSDESLSTTAEPGSDFGSSNDDIDSLERQSPDDLAIT